jgi:hypothetical protein
MPVYNGAEYVAEAIESVLAQTYTNMEIVVVEDGSTDDGATRRVIERFGDRVKYIHQENMGVAGALNTGVANMTGEFFTWLSHDDLFLPGKIAAQVAFYQAIGREDVVLYSDYSIIDEGGQELFEVRFDKEYYATNPAVGLLNGSINGCTVFVPRTAFDRIGLFDLKMRHTQDYDLWKRMGAMYSFVHLPKVLVRTRTHPKQDSRQPAAVAEGEALWIDIVESKSEVEQALAMGSSRRYFKRMAEFLKQTPYQNAAARIAARAEASLDDVLVSVIIPFYNEVSLVVRAVLTVQAQSHKRLEVILIDDGSTENISELERLVANDPRLYLIRGPNQGAAAARNRGLDLAQGDYIAFLDADDTFLPNKIEIQLKAMQDTGKLFSHTSYHVVFPERGLGQGTIPSGRLLTGRAYPQIVAGCPIATPTVMLHRALVLGGARFREAERLGEDVLLWIELAREYEILGIDQPLSVVEWSSGSAAINLDKSIAGISGMLEAFKSIPYLSAQRVQIESLERARGDLEAQREKARAERGDLAPLLNEVFIKEIFDPARLAA